MDVGYRLIDEYGRIYALAKENPFSFKSTVNKGLEWTANFHYVCPRVFTDYTKFTLQIQVGSLLCPSPPLVPGSPHNTKEGKGGDSSDISGVGFATYALSQKALDKPTYTKTTADQIILDLASNIELAAGYVVSIPILGQLPTFYVEEWDVTEGSRLSHIEALLQQGGCCFYEGGTGALYVAPMDHYSLSGLGTGWIQNINMGYDPAQRRSKQKIIKTSKLQTHFEFPFIIEASESNPIQGAGLQQVSFSTPLKRGSVQFSWESVSGYIDEVSYHDAQGQQVGEVFLTYPENHTGVTYPVGTSLGPITAAKLWIYPAKDVDGNYIATQTLNVTAIFDGLPEGDYSGIDLAFEVEEDISELTSGYTKRDWTIVYSSGEGETYEEHTVTVEELLVDSNSYFYYRHSFFPTLAAATARHIVPYYEVIVSQVPGAWTPVSFADPIRPCDGDEYIDGGAMPTQEHANSVKGLLLYDKIKGQKKISYRGGVPLPMIQPLEAIDYPRKPRCRVESISVTRDSTIAECCPVKWW